MLLKDRMVNSNLASVEELKVGSPFPATSFFFAPRELPLLGELPGSVGQYGSVIFAKP